MAPTPSPVAPVYPLIAAADIAKATAVVAGLAVAFLDQRAPRDAAFLRERLTPRTSAASDVETALAEEASRGARFRQLAQARLSRDLPVALAIPDPERRAQAVRGVMAREALYSRQRAEAMAARAIASVDRMVLRRESPQGALWKLDPTVIEHTAGCLVMGGRFWPWEVLDRVHPPRHPACPCRLIGYGAAVRQGLLSAGAVMNVADAVKAAAGVVMEAEEAARVLAELES